MNIVTCPIRIFVGAHVRNRTHPVFIYVLLSCTVGLENQLSLARSCLPQSILLQRIIGLDLESKDHLRNNLKHQSIVCLFKQTDI